MSKASLGEKGMAHLLSIAVAVVVLACVGLIGWKVVSNASSYSSGTGNSSEGSGSPCMKTYNDNKLCEFASHYTPLNKVAYQATINVTSPEGTLSNLTYENDGTGNTSLSGTSDGQNLSTVELNGAIYVKTAGSGWIEYPAGSTDAVAQTDPIANMNINVSSSNLTFEYVGTEACGSLSCYKYSITDKTVPNATQDIMFDTGSYILRQWGFQGSTGTTDMSINYQPVSIPVPSPVTVK